MLIFAYYLSRIYTFLCSRKQHILMLKRILCVLTLTLLAATSVFSQVTTSNLSGIIKSKSGTSLAGASIIAVHLPTGTTYRTLSRSGGTFDLPNVTPGGPYKIDVTFVGYESTSQFSREYARFFGNAPMKDIVRLRAQGFGD